MPPLAARLIQKCLQVNPHLRPTAQELLNDEWFVSLGIAKKKTQEFKFKETEMEQVYQSDRSGLDRKEPAPRHVSQGRGVAVAEKIQSTINRSIDKRLGGYGNGVLSSTSMGKFQTDNYSSINKQSTNNLSSTLKEFGPTTPSNYHQGSPMNESKDSPSQPLQLRSHSRGRPEDDKQKYFFNNTNPMVPSYTQSSISATDLGKKPSETYVNTTEASTPKQASYSQLASYSNLPPKQLYPLLQNSQQSPVYEIHQQVMGSPYQPQTPPQVSNPPQPVSLSSTLKSALTPTQSTPPEMPKATDTAPGPRQDQSRIAELEAANEALEHKNSVMAKDLKDLKKVNSQLKAAIESLQNKDSAFEKMKRDRERIEKELEEKKLETNRIKEDYEVLKNEVIEVARFIRTNLKPNWVVSLFHFSLASKMN